MAKKDSKNHAYLAILAMVAAVGLVSMVLNLDVQNEITGNLGLGPSCQDSDDISGDGGRVPGKQGTLTYQKQNSPQVRVTDKCLNREQLLENFCEGFENKQTIIDCTKFGQVCEAGACK